MGGMVPTETTQTTQPCTTLGSGGVVSTDAGALLFDSGSAFYAVGPKGLDSLGNVQAQVYEFPLHHNGAPMEGPDPADPNAIPANGDYYYESTESLGSLLTVAYEITTDGTSSGRPIAHANSYLDVLNPLGPTARARLIIYNTEDPPTGGKLFNVVIHGPVVRYHITQTEHCTPPPENPVPVPVAPPTPSGRVTINEQHPGLVVAWRRDNRWPDIVTINQQGLGVSITHPRLTGAGSRLMLLTGIEHQFKVRDNPPSWEVESTYTLERIPDTNIEGGHLFFTFDDDFAGFDTGILSD